MDKTTIPWGAFGYLFEILLRVCWELGLKYMIWFIYKKPYHEMADGFCLSASPDKQRIFTSVPDACPVGPADRTGVPLW